MNDLCWAHFWLENIAKQRRDPTIATKGKTKPQMIAAVFAAVRDRVLPDELIRVARSRLMDYLESNAVYPLGVYAECNMRGWISETSNGEFIINENNLAKFDRKSVPEVPTGFCSFATDGDRGECEFVDSSALGRLEYQGKRCN